MTDFADISVLQDTGLAAPPQAPKQRSELGQEDFLKLMITQFKNQDPFEPMDNGDFLGQLAQFSTVKGISSLNDGFAGLSASLESDQILQAASLVGHSVLASMSGTFIEKGGEINGAVELDSSASNVEVEITNGAGEIVRRFDLGQQGPGLARFSWDGRDDSNDKVPDGRYFVTVRVERGAMVENAETLLEQRIESVSLGRYGQGMTLNLPGGDTLPVGQVRRII
jgi:flagellar basal-body rod modification protein FlgD